MNAASSKPLLTISGQGTSLQAKAGSITLLRGDVGSGKTLWLERMAGLLDAPKDISIAFERGQITTKNRVRMLFDRSPPVWLGQSIAEELCFGLSTLPTAETLQQALQTWGIDELMLDSDVQELNRLQGVRLALAAMELAAPSLVLLDNPSDSLPQAAAARLIDDIHSWVQRSNCIMVAACNRWQDWQHVATQVWLSSDPASMPRSTSEEPPSA